MNRDKIINFIKYKIKENHGHIGIHQEVIYVGIFNDIYVIKDINIYSNGIINYISIIEDSCYVSDSNCLLETRSTEFLNALCKEIHYNRYL